MNALNVPREVIEAELRVSDWMAEQGFVVWELGYSRNRYPHGDSHHAASVHVTHDGAAAVDPDYYWRDMTTCPRGVKVQLLNAGGVAVYATFDGSDPQWQGWAPLPKVRKP